MKKVKTHKAFHLVHDTTSSVPEKVFLVEDSLKHFERGLSSSLDMLGVIGPQASIKQAVAMLDRGLSSPEEDQKEEYDIDLSLEPNEKAAIYLIKLDSEREKGRHCCIAVLSAPDSFYYQKPFDAKSILYLLVRYLGDMCSTISLAYDSQVEQDFQLTGCPYAESETFIAQLKMTTRSVRDIKVQWHPFNTKALLDFNTEYYRGVNFLTPDHNNSMVFVNKVLAESYKARFQDELNKSMTICWDNVFGKTCLNPDKVVALMGR